MLFGLAEWRDGMSQFSKDLVPEILARGGRPLTAPELLREMRKLRSVSTSSIVSAIRRAPGVCDCGDGCYGLCSWGVAANPVFRPVPSNSSRCWPIVKAGRIDENHRQFLEAIDRPASWVENRRAGGFSRCSS